MLKKSISLVALGVITAAIATATTPVGDKVVTLLKSVVPAATSLTEASTDATPQKQQSAAIDYEALNAEALQTVIGQDQRPEAKDLNLVEAEPTPPDTPSEGKLQFADAQLMASVRKNAPRRVTRGSEVTVKTGDVIEVDHLTSGTNYGFHASIDLVNADDASQGYKLSNFYSLSDTVSLKFTVDTATGTVSVPKQVLYTHATYGEVSFVGVIVKDGTRYLSSDPVTGTIDDDGNITLGAWARIVSEADSQYYGAAFSITTGSEWRVPNGQVSEINMSTGLAETFPVYISQEGQSSVAFYGLTKVMSEYTARLTSTKTVVMPSQYAYYNAFYGQFNIFGATWTQQEDESWKVSVDSKNSIVFTLDADGNLSVPGLVIAAESLPSSYIAYAYRDFKVATTAITWPEAAKINFAGDGTAASPYQITSAADLSTLSQLVSEGNSFAGSYFELANDVDMSSVSSRNYIPVGDVNTPFDGIFDGKNRKISGLYLDGGSFAYTGIFGYTGENSVIKNLIVSFTGVSAGANLGAICGYSGGTIESCDVTAVLDSDGECVGGIAGLAKGAIKNCTFYGNIYAEGSAGGIVGQGSCDIDGCSVRAIIKTDGYTSTLCHDNGGIAGVIQSGSIRNSWSTGTLNESYGRSATGGVAARCISSTVENCFSSAYISATRTYTDSSGGGDTNTGGILGYTYNSVMNNCYSSSTIIKTGTSEYCGGVVGYIGVTYQTSSAYSGVHMNNNSTITNCYYSGYINSASTNDLKPMYGSTYIYSAWTGEDPDKLCFSNCYYDKQVNSLGEDYYGRNTSFFTNGLPEGFSSDVWEAKAGYYPVLKNVGAGTQAQAISSAPIVLRDQQTAKKVKVGFTLTPADNITWSIYGATDGESDALKMDGNNVTVKSIYSTSQIQALSADGMSLKLYLLAVVPKLFDGEGTAEDPYQVKSVADLKTLHSAVATYHQDHAGDYFAMTNDIDCAAADGETAFSGVGSGSGYSFGGSFDGRGYSVKNLKIDAIVADAETGKATTSSANYCGLFGVVNSDGTVKNVNIDKSCSFRFYRYSGAVVGINNGTVDNCRNYADITAVSTTNGALVGANNTDAVISNGYNSGRVSGGSTYIGGITSYNYGKISLCQNDGDVIGEVNDSVNVNTTRNTFGGVAAYNSGTIEYSVNNGQVVANNTVGGIAGRNTAGSIIGSLNSGLVSSEATTSYRGAIIGYQQSIGTIANNYYDSSININGGSHNSNIDGITGLSTSELVAGVCPAELKALGAEDIYDFTANAYPVLKQFATEETAKAIRTMYVAFTPGQLRSNVTTDVELSPAEGITWSLAEESKYFKVDGKKLVITAPTDTVPTAELVATLGSLTKSYALTSVPVIFSGSGTEASPYLIETAADWNKLSDFVAKSGWEYKDQYFKVTNDIDFAGDSIKVIAYGGTAFRGVLDGAGHTVKNYVYSNTNTTTVASKLVGPNLYQGRYIGLFGTLGSEGVVKNLTIDGQFEAVGYIGALVGYLYGTVENVIHKGKVSNTSGAYVGGIAYRVYSGGTLTDCVNEGTVVAKTTTAVGIAVETQAGTTLTRCYNRGTVTSTTTAPSGIAYKVSGGLIDCGNERPVNGTGSIIGLVNVMDSTAYAVRCYNTADLGASDKSTVSGLFNTFTARYNSKYPDSVPAGGYVEDCYNSGDITAKDYGYGFANKINGGWTITNCHNSGDVTSAALACGFANAIAGSNVNFLTLVDHCYNSGDVTGKKAGVSGFSYDGSNYSKFTYCYNTGKIVNTLTTGLTTAGLVGRFNGYMDHCFNAGDVESSCNAVGGLVGYISYGKEDYPGRMISSFNIGNVTCQGYTGTSGNGNAGGLAGYFATSNATYWVEVNDCYNAGTVKSDKRVGGLCGGSFQVYAQVNNCYNSGRVISNEQSGGTYAQSALVYSTTAEKQPTMTNVYYDKSATTIAEPYETVAKGLTTSQFKELSISDAFTASENGGYPVLKGFDEETVGAAANKAGSIMILVANEETESQGNVSDAITLIAPQGTVWEVYESNSGELEESEKMTIDGNTAKPVSAGDVVLVATTPDKLSRSFSLTLNPTATGIENVNAGKTVESVVYVDLQGRVVPQPVAGNVYVVRTNYTDGTSSVVKMLAR